MGNVVKIIIFTGQLKCICIHSNHFSLFLEDWHGNKDGSGLSAIQCLLEDYLWTVNFSWDNEQMRSSDVVVSCKTCLSYRAQSNLACLEQLSFLFYCFYFDVLLSQNTMNLNFDSFSVCFQVQFCIEQTNSRQLTSSLLSPQLLTPSQRFDKGRHTRSLRQRNCLVGGHWNLAEGQGDKTCKGHKSEFGQRLNSSGIS